MALGSEFATVLDAARTGAEWAWRALYRDLAPAVLGYLHNHGASSPEDACGDVFCDIVRRIGEFQGDEAGFRGWVFLIARHRVIDEHRRTKRRPRIASSPVDAEAHVGPVSTEDEALERIEMDKVRELLGGLTPIQRDVVLLRVVAGLSVEEVAKIVGKRPGSVRALAHRALGALRKDLGARNGIDVLDGS